MMRAGEWAKGGQISSATHPKPLRAGTQVPEVTRVCLCRNAKALNPPFWYIRLGNKVRANAGAE